MGRRSRLACGSPRAASHRLKTAGDDDGTIVVIDWDGRSSTLATAMRRSVRKLSENIVHQSGHVPALEKDWPMCSDTRPVGPEHQGSAHVELKEVP
jgi:hypothetical protein